MRVFQSDHFSLLSHDSCGSTGTGLCRPVTVFQPLYFEFSTSAAILHLFVTSGKQLDAVGSNQKYRSPQPVLMSDPTVACKCL